MRRLETDSFLSTLTSRERNKTTDFGELAQLGERLVCNQEVTGSSPVFSTNLRSVRLAKVAHRSPKGDGGLLERRTSYGWQASGSWNRIEIEGRAEDRVAAL